MLDPARCEPKRGRADEDVYAQLSNTGFHENFYDAATQQTSLNVRFMKAVQVNRSRKKMLKTKVYFLMQQAHLKNLGQKNRLMTRIMLWIEDHLDEIHDKFTLQ